MRNFSYINLTAGLLLFLAASPARADLATPEADDPQVLSALRALTVLVDSTATLSDNSAFVSETKSTGPQSVPFTSKGVDSSNGPMGIMAARFGSVGLTSPATESAFAAAYLAAAPSGFGHGEGSHVVPSPSAPSADFSGLATSSAPQAVTNLVVNQVLVPAVPIPASVLLLVSGLLAIFPWRRSSRFPLEV